jgi:hypothetical protein
MEVPRIAIGYLAPKSWFPRAVPGPGKRLRQTNYQVTEYTPKFLKTQAARLSRQIRYTQIDEPDHSEWAKAGKSEPKSRDSCYSLFQIDVGLKNAMIHGDCWQKP